MSDLRMMKGEETYRKLIEAAMDIIAEEGVSGLSAGKVSLRAGVSKSNIFHHFKSIDDIPIAVLDTLLNEVMYPLSQMKVDSVDMIFDAFETMLFQGIQKDDRINKIFYAFYYTGMFHERYQAVMDRFLMDAMDYLGDKLMYVSRRDIKISEARRYATLILSMLDGMGLHLLLGVKREHYLNSWHLLKQVIVRELDDHENRRP